MATGITGTCLVDMGRGSRKAKRAYVMLPTEISRYGVMDDLGWEFGGSFPVAVSGAYVKCTLAPAGSMRAFCHHAIRDLYSSKCSNFGCIKTA